MEYLQPVYVFRWFLFFANTLSKLECTDLILALLSIIWKVSSSFVVLHMQVYIGSHLYRPTHAKNYVDVTRKLLCCAWDIKPSMSSPYQITSLWHCPYKNLCWHHKETAICPEHHKKWRLKFTIWSNQINVAITISVSFIVYTRLFPIRDSLLSQSYYRW